MSINEKNPIKSFSQRPTLKKLALRFLHLGTFCFGGPVVLTQRMNQDFVKDRNWFTEDEFEEGLTLSQLAPGPLATQIGIYLGWLHSGVIGATLCLFCFLLPSFLIMVGLSILYLRYGSIHEVQDLFFGVGSSVMALITLSSLKISKTFVGNNWILILIALTSLISHLWLKSSGLFFFLACGGFVALLDLAKRKISQKMDLGIPVLMTISYHSFYNSLFIDIQKSLKIFWFFIKSGAVVFGSGLAILPFLQEGLVHQLHWLTDRQFLDGVTLALITPGPVVITTVFMGYLIHGITGSILAGFGTFLPCYLITITFAPFLEKFKNIPFFRKAISGITASAAGALLGSAIQLGEKTLINPSSIIIFGLSLFCFKFLKKIPEPVIMFLFGIIFLWLRKIKII